MEDNVQKNNAKLIVLSAGGTGGHMMPAQALAKDLLSRGYRVALVTDGRGMGYASMFEGIPMYQVRAGTLGRGWAGKVKGVAGLVCGLLQAGFLLMRQRPSMVVGFGGYPSFPAVFAAQKLRIPTIIHEQNAILGKANAMLAPKALRIALSLPVVAGLEEVDKMRAVMTGNPVRSAVAALFTEPYPNMELEGPLRILVMGGSLGAHVFSAVVPGALAQLPPAYRRRLEIVQQCREGDLEAVRTVYETAGIAARLDTFFDDVPALLQEAHLVICRSGASTVAEAATAGRPAIFVPYPYHKDQQQKRNADALADAGGGWVMVEGGFTQEALLARIEMFLQSPEILFKAAEKARACGRPDAARKLGNLVTALVSGWKD